MARVFESDDYDGSQHFEIPFGFTEIGENAFFMKRSLKSVRIPRSVITISKTAFSYCTGLKDINIPSSVTKIEERAFELCTTLPSVTIPNSVSELGSGAFKDCTRLISVTLPNSVKIINKGTFVNCVRLEIVNLSDGLKEIGMHAFENCCSLKTITIPESVEKLGWMAFRGCSALMSFVFPANLVSIERSIFINCDNLHTLVFTQKFEDLRDPNMWARNVIYPLIYHHRQIPKIYVRPEDVNAFLGLCTFEEPHNQVEILPLPTLDPAKIRSLISKDMRIMSLQKFIHPPVSNRKINLGERPYTANQKRWIATFMMAAYVATKAEGSLPYLPVEIRNMILEFLTREDAKDTPLAITATRELLFL